MAITELSLSAGCLPLRAHPSRCQQPSISTAASAQFRHLHQVASWAALLVPPLGAYLGSCLASTSEILGCPPPSSPHFTCQRCESVLHVGINCSFRLKRNKLKKRGRVTKGVSAPINSFMYSCQHCAFESKISGTTKAYVKTKLNERAALLKLSEPYQSLDVCKTEKAMQPIKAINNDLSSFAVSTQSPGSTSKKTKRKGWLSLKQLSASAVGRPALSMKSVNPPFLPQLSRLESAKVMPTVSEVNLKYSIFNSDVVGEFCIKTASKVELSEDDAGSEKVLDVSTSSGVGAASLWSDAEIMIPISEKVGEFICSESRPANMTDSFQHSDALGTGMIVEDKSLKQMLSIHHTDADAAILKQLPVLASVLKHSAQHTVSSMEGKYNLSYAVSPNDSTTVTSISSSQGLRTIEDVILNSNSLRLVEDAGLSVMVESSIDNLDDQEKKFPSNDQEGIHNNSSIIKAVRWKKRKHDDVTNSCNVPREQENCKSEANRVRSVDWDSDIKQTSGVKLSGICENIDTQMLACEKIKPRTKKKPVFRRVGRHWFTTCKASRTLRWRIL